MDNHGRYVCACNVHMTMEAYDDPDFAAVVNGAALVLPDGMPLKWYANLRGARLPDRVRGPTLALHLCAAAAKAGIPIGLYGGHPDALATLTANLERMHSGLRIAYAWTPPFRPLTPEEDAAETTRIVASGTRILLVGLGCPKQERWMAAHRDRLPCVQIGVGAFFDLHSGRTHEAPAWLQHLGLEWLYRLIGNPRRLWRRYLWHNPRFIILAGWQLLRSRKTSS